MSTTTLAPSESHDFPSFQGALATKFTVSVASGSDPGAVKVSCPGIGFGETGYLVSDGNPAVVRGAFWGATVTILNDGAVDITVESPE